jgi:hypothetical protein
VLQNQSAEIGVLNAAGKYHAGFWIPKTGCLPLLLKASIAGSKAQRPSACPSPAASSGPPRLR